MQESLERQHRWMRGGRLIGVEFEGSAGRLRGRENEGSDERRVNLGRRGERVNELCSKRKGDCEEQDEKRVALLKYPPNETRSV
jgi:hypothetical protein